MWRDCIWLQIRKYIFYFKSSFWARELEVSAT